MAYFSIEAMVRGYHVYESIWTAAIGEEPLQTLSTFSTCSSPSDCVWYRSKVMHARKNILYMFKFS
jgi:hypothetical protein